MEGEESIEIPIKQCFSTGNMGHHFFILAPSPKPTGKPVPHYTTNQTLCIINTIKMAQLYHTKFTPVLTIIRCKCPTPVPQEVDVSLHKKPKDITNKPFHHPAQVL